MKHAAMFGNGNKFEWIVEILNFRNLQAAVSYIIKAILFADEMEQFH